MLDSEKTAEILLELEDDLREKILSRLSPKEIAEELDELETNDAADIIAELSQSKKQEVISELQDVEHAKDIVDLLRYKEDTAGGIMHKELVKVNENWDVFTCIKQMRIQAKNISRVHSIYVVDDEDRLLGRLSLKDLLTTAAKTPISEVYIKKLNSVIVDTEDVEVARIMQKYDLEAIPVTDELGRLVGRIQGRSRSGLPVGCGYHARRRGWRQYSRIDKSALAMAFDRNGYRNCCFICIKKQ